MIRRVRRLVLPVLAVLASAPASARAAAPERERCAAGEWVPWRPDGTGPQIELVSFEVSSFTAAGRPAPSGRAVFRARLEVRTSELWRPIEAGVFKSIELWDASGLFGQVKGWKLLRTGDARAAKEAAYPGRPLELTLEFPVDQSVQPSSLIVTGERRISFELAISTRGAPSPAPPATEKDTALKLDPSTWAPGEPSFRVSSATVAGRWYDGKSPGWKMKVLRLWLTVRSASNAAFEPKSLMDAAVLGEGGRNLAGPEPRFYKEAARKRLWSLRLKPGQEVPVVMDIPLAAPGTPAAVMLVRDGRLLEMRLAERGEALR